MSALAALDETVVMPTNFSLSNIDRLVAWCKRHCDRAAAALRKARAQSPVDAWNSGNSGQDKWAAEYESCSQGILDAIAESAFSTEPALARFAEIIGGRCEKAGLTLLAVKKELVLFSAEHLSTWRQATDSIDSLVESGLTANAAFFGEFLDAARLDNASWGERIKLCVLAREVEISCGQLITSDFVLDKLSDCQARVQVLMQELFLLRCAGNMRAAIARYEATSSHKFEQFYNRGSKNIRVNALREIVKDLDLFTACFPRRAVHARGGQHALPPQARLL